MYSSHWALILAPYIACLSPHNVCSRTSCILSLQHLYFWSVCDTHTWQMWRSRNSFFLGSRHHIFFDITPCESIQIPSQPWSVFINHKGLAWVSLCLHREIWCRLALSQKVFAEGRHNFICFSTDLSLVTKLVMHTYMKHWHQTPVTCMTCASFTIMCRTFYQTCSFNCHCTLFSCLACTPHERWLQQRELGASRPCKNWCQRGALHTTEEGSSCSFDITSFL